MILKTIDKLVNSNMNQERDETRNFSTEIVGEMIKSKGTLIYLFQISGMFNRIFSPTIRYVHTFVFKGPFEKLKEVAHGLSYCWNSRHSSNQGD